MCMEEYNLRDLFQQTSGGLRLAEWKRTGFRFGGAGRRQAGRGWTLGAQGCSLVNEEWRPQFIARNRDGPRRDDVYAAVLVSLLAWGSACASLTPLTLQVCASARVF